MDVVATPQENLNEQGSVPLGPDEVVETPSTLAPVPAIPRPFGFADMIHRWQPMGIRVVLKLPFFSNDSQYLFMIRHNPYIPWLGEECPNVVYWFNNLFPVKHQPPQLRGGNLDGSPLVITQHSPPPLLSMLSQAHREWRGSIKYRLRTISNFTTQGYMFATMLRDRPVVMGKCDPFHSSFIIPQRDYSYTEGMVNSYIMSDVSNFRHIEAVVPFEYPVPWFDQFNYLTRGVYDPGMKPRITDPHGDSYLAFGLRGPLSGEGGTKEIIFELEYAAGIDFQFGNPFLLPPAAFVPKARFMGKTDPASQAKVLTALPYATIASDGLNQITSNS